MAGEETPLPVLRVKPEMTTHEKSHGQLGSHRMRRS